MTPDPSFPPRHRGVAARRLTFAATLGRFELPVCEDCSSVQYPVREVCANCLSDRLEWKPVASGGVLLSRTALHHSNEPWFRPHLPVHIGSVLLDAGPVAIMLLAPDCGDAGTRVRVECRLDQGGEAVLVAAAERPGL